MHFGTMNILVILHVQCYNNKNWSNITVWYKKHILTQSTDFKSCSTNIFHHSHGNIWFCWFILFSRNPRKRVHLYSQIWMKLMLTKVILRVRHFAVFFKMNLRIYESTFSSTYIQGIQLWTWFSGGCLPQINSK